VSGGRPRGGEGGMRPVRKGGLTFDLVTMPTKDKRPIAYRRVCSEENVTS
jgi:hypothetical protein